MDDVTQQNAGLVQSAAQVAKRLEDQVAEVERAISVFRLKETTARPAAVRAPQASRPAVAATGKGMPNTGPAAMSAKGSSGKPDSRRDVPVVEEWESF
jgi:hypothetical protein